MSGQPGRHLNRKTTMKLLLGLSTVTLPLASCAAQAQLTSGTMNVHWNEGAEDCTKNTQPPLQAHAYNARTFILRESLCMTYEAPFMYLLVGSDKALLIDTGDVADSKDMPLAQTVSSLLPGDGTSKLPLIVVHTHGHLDHRTGDAQFQSWPHVDIVPTDLEHVKQYFGLTAWPNGITQLDIGNRVVDIISVSGHHSAHVAYYDRQTGLFFSGDFLLPGRLLIEDADAEVASAQRAADFAKDRPVSYVLGGHIELDEDGGTFFGNSHHPHERALQLSKQDLLALPNLVADFNGIYSQRGVYLLMNQNRLLVILGSAVLLVFVAAVFGVRRIWRRVRWH